MLEEAEAADAHPALTQVVVMQGLVMGRSGTKKARIRDSALLPECQGSWKCEGSRSLLLLCKDKSAAAECSACRQGKRSHGQAPVLLSAAVKGEKWTYVVF